jgi:hypothetical protein
VVLVIFVCLANIGVCLSFLTKCWKTLFGLNTYDTFTV